MVMVAVMVLTTMVAEAINKCPAKWEQHSPHPFLHIITHTRRTRRRRREGWGKMVTGLVKGENRKNFPLFFPGLEDGISEGLWEQLRVRVCTWIFKPRLVPA